MLAIVSVYHTAMQCTVGTAVKPECNNFLLYWTTWLSRLITFAFRVCSFKCWE